MSGYLVEKLVYGALGAVFRLSFFAVVVRIRLPLIVRVFKFNFSLIEGLVESRWEVVGLCWIVGIWVIILLDMTHYGQK